MRRLLLTLLLTSAALAHEPAEPPRTKLQEAMRTAGQVLITEQRTLGKAAQLNFIAVSVTTEIGAVVRGIQINTPNGAAWLDEDEVTKFTAALAKIRTIHADWQKDTANRNYATARFETPSGVGIETFRNFVDARGRRIDFNLIAGGERYTLTAADLAQIETLLTAS